MTTRDDEFAQLAAEFAAAENDVRDAERRAAEAAAEVNDHRLDRDRIKKKLAGFVGENIRTRNAVIRGAVLVRVEYAPGHPDPTARVTVEDVTLTRGAA